MTRIQNGKLIIEPRTDWREPKVPCRTPQEQRAAWVAMHDEAEKLHAAGCRSGNCAGCA